MNSSDDLKCEKRKFEVKILSEVMNAIEVMNSIGVMYSNDELKCLKVKLIAVVLLILLFCVIFMVFEVNKCTKGEDDKDSCQVMLM